MENKFEELKMALEMGQFEKQKDILNCLAAEYKIKFIKKIKECNTADNFDKVLNRYNPSYVYAKVERFNQKIQTTLQGYPNQHARYNSIAELSNDYWNIKKKLVTMIERIQGFEPCTKK